MAMSISSAFDKAKLKYTGRHWWAPTLRVGVGQSLSQERRAERIANRLGLDVIPPDKTGTSIMVVSPRLPEVDFDDEDPTLEAVLDEMISAARLYGWPLMVGRNGHAAVEFEFSQRGGTWQPDAPDAPDSPVRHFVEAYRIAKQGPPTGPTSWHYEKTSPLAAVVPSRSRWARWCFAISLPLKVLLNPRTLASLSLQLRLCVNLEWLWSSLDVTRHPLGSSTVGVFIADSKFDRQFAESEPVAHDEWLPAKIASAKYAPNPVRQALDKIKQGIKHLEDSRIELVARIGRRRNRTRHRGHARHASVC